MIARKIVQIAGSDNRIYALADDGMLWEMNHSGEWDEHPQLPPKPTPKASVSGRPPALEVSSHGN